MENTINTISQKITLLNQITVDSMMEKNSRQIIKNFTELGIQILEADFGFAWWKSEEDKEYRLAYKSPNTPYEPTIPREKAGNYIARTTKRPFFDSEVKKKNYEYDISKYLKSYIIIPICHGDDMYGSLVLCYKKPHLFPEDEITLSIALGNSVAQTITIHRLLGNELEARQHSERQEAYFRALVENGHEIITLIDKNGKVIYISPSVTQIFGLEVEKVIGKTIDEFIHETDGTDAKKYLKDILQNPEEKHVTEFFYKHTDKSIRTLEATALNLLDNPNIEGIVINIRDVTENKKAELEKETRQLLDQEKMKVGFIADANHELRTPLAIIKGNVDLILMDAGRKQRRYADEALQNIDEEVKHLSNILSDLAILTSNSDSLQNKVTYRTVDISKLIDQNVKRLKIVARKKKISIRTNTMGPVEIMGDSKYLDTVFSNLIKNAITYGKLGGWIKIEIKKNKTMIEVKISDNGIGISIDDLPHIFERFYRADKAHTDANRTGLGLAIVKWIVESHGGDVNVKSTLGKGTIFTIGLPLKPY